MAISRSWNPHLAKNQRDVGAGLPPSLITAAEVSAALPFVIPTEAKWRDLLFPFCPSDLTAPNKSHHPPICHPDRSVAEWRDLLCASLPRKCRVGENDMFRCFPNLATDLLFNIAKTLLKAAHANLLGAAYRKSESPVIFGPRTLRRGAPIPFLQRFELRHSRLWFLEPEGESPAQQD